MRQGAIIREDGPYAGSFSHDIEAGEARGIIVSLTRLQGPSPITLRLTSKTPAQAEYSRTELNCSENDTAYRIAIYPGITPEETSSSVKRADVVSGLLTVSVFPSTTDEETEYSLDYELLP